MSDTNLVVLKGRLTRAAELKVLPSGTPCTSMSLAVNESRKNSNTGQYDSIPNYFDAVSYGKYAQSAITSLTRGREVLISGRLKQERWDKDGKTQSRIVVITDNIEILREPKGASASSQDELPPPPSATPDGQPEDIPF